MTALAFCRAIEGNSALTGRFIPGKVMRRSHRIAFFNPFLSLSGVVLWRLSSAPMRLLLPAAPCLAPGPVWAFFLS